MKKLLLGAGAFLALFITMPATSVSAAACATPATNMGSATLNVSVPATGAYRVWSRILAPDTTNNSFLLEIDGNSCYTVANGQLPVNSWTWADYQNGTTSSKINVTLSSGNHSLKLIGSEPNVAVDRVLLVADTACTPTGTGANCLVDADQTPPVTTITAPAANATVSGTVPIQATASDASGINKVDFSIDGSLKSTVTTAPYSYSWNTAAIANGTHTIKVTAYDKVGNSTPKEITVTVRNNDQQAPTAPSNVRATVSSSSAVVLNWSASTDNVAVSGYYVQRNNVTIAQLGATTSYTDSTVAAGSSYTYRIVATDAAGNLSPASATATASVPSSPVKDTQSPTAPGQVQATAVSTTQINLTWNASTDNIAVARYFVYRSAGGSQASKIATVTSPSYGDSGLTANTKYSYYIVAQDAAQNSSSASSTVSATTATQPVTNQRGRITGKITLDSNQGRSIAAAVVDVNGHRRGFIAGRNGEYVISRLPAGTYSVTYFGYGELGGAYQSQTLKVTVSAGNNTVQNVTLKKR